MNNISNTLKEREKLNKSKINLADEYNNNSIHDKGNFAEEIKTAVRDILSSMDIHLEEVSIQGCESITDILDCMLDPLGVMYEKVEVSSKLFRDRSDIMLAIDNNNHALVLKSDLFGYNCTDVSKERKGKARPENLQKYAYVIYQPIPSGKNALKNLLQLMSNLISVRDVLPVIIATLIVTTCGAVVPEISSYVLKNLVPEGMKAIPLINGFIVLLIIAGAVKSVFAIIKSYVLGKTVQRVSFDVQAAVIAKMLLDSDNNQNYTAGEYSTRIKKGRELATTVIHQCFSTYMTAFFSLGYLIQIEDFSEELLTPVLLVIIMRIVVAYASSQVTARNEQNIIRTDSEINSVINQSLKGIQKIRSSGATATIYSYWMKKYSDGIMMKLNPPSLTKYKGAIDSLISGLATVILLSIAIVESVDVSDYYAFTASYALVMVTVDLVIESIYSYTKIKSTLGYLNDLFTTEKTDVINKEYVKRLNGRIALNDVDFKYPTTGATGLSDISLTIERGEKIAIVGESGCGKSTMLKLLLGMLEPDNGSISYDGVDVKNLNMRSVRKCIGSVFQFSKVVPGTIEENIRMSDDELSIEELWEAAEKAAIADDIRAFPDGMDTVVTESNSGGMSGGQRQRILLARAFAAKPSVMILDEATSALDNISQSKVLDEVYKLDATVIMVAHRLSTVEGCDRIIALREGRICEVGSYRELMEKNGYFAELVAKQMV